MLQRSRAIAVMLLAMLPYIPLLAQVQPAEGSCLNYRIIGFEFPPASFPKGANCKIEVAAGNYNDSVSFKRNIIYAEYLHTNKAIIEVPAFGASYSWRVSFSNKDLAFINNKIHHFTTCSTANVDTNRIRLRILTHTYKYKDMFVFLDAARALYDMSGHPVWFLPRVDSSNNGVQDLKLSPQGTLTFIAGNIYETDYNGKVLWEKVAYDNIDGIPTEYYHHEFTRLHNGHYMALNNERVSWSKNQTSGGINFTAAGKKAGGNYIDFGKLIEFDEKGKVVWSWSAASYYKALWLSYFNTSNNIYNDVHANSFFFDEKKNYVYISFKNVNQVIKIKYPEGNVLNVYGDPDAANDPESKTSLFCNQHACNISLEGNLYLFNNNNRHSGILPEVLVMQEPKQGSNELKTIWKYECPLHVDNDIEAKSKEGFTSGGNVTELPDHAMFISMCDAYGTLFIVGRNKKILWSAIIERWDSYLRKWVPSTQYRASLIKTKKELDRFIWGNL